ncbi:MAG: hypothetical protein JXA15_03655 [Spirochaetales bacterium]|nr:hypothetical protein [Spirochaetales bacterium]
MNTTPGTPDPSLAAYTVIGSGGRPAPASRISVVVLNRGGRIYRARQLQDLERAGFAEVVSVEEGGEGRHELEALVSRFPSTRFAVVPAGLTPGERANIGFREARMPWVLLLWNDQKLAAGGLSSRFVDRIEERAWLCATPWYRARDGETLPAIGAPALEGSALRVLSLEPREDGEKALFPLDYAGVYSKARFEALGGFDREYSRPWWQLVEFGFRAWLRGELLGSAQALRVDYVEAPPAYDTSPGPDYRRFHLRSLAPVRRSDAAHLPWSRFLPYAAGAGVGIGEAYREFKAARAWVADNAFRFRVDARALVDLWEPIP